MQSRRSGLAWPVFLILAVTAVVYWPSFQVDWTLDDRRVIVDNPLLRSVADALTRVGTSTRSLVDLTFSLNFAAGGLNPRGYHLVNLLIHGLGAICLFGWLRSVLPAANERVAVFAGLLFAAHPLATQSVTYVTQRYSSMAGMFYFGSLWAWTLWRQQRERHWYVTALLSAVAAMLCKEMAVTIPIALFAVEKSLLEKELPRVQPAHVPLILLLGVVPLLNWLGRQGATLTESLDWSGGVEVARSTYFLSQIRIIVGDYLRLMIVPIGLNLDHAYAVITSPNDARTVACGLFLVAAAIASIGAVFFTRSWRSRLAGYLGILFFLGLAATSSLVPNSEFIQEQRAYVSLAAIIGLFVLGLEAIPLPSRAFNSLTACLVVALAAGTISRNKAWQNEVELWRDTLQKNPNSARAYSNIGFLMRQQGDHGKALAAYRSAVRVMPNHYLLHYNLGVEAAGQGLLDEAIPAYREAARLRPDDFPVRYNLANALSKSNRLEEAVAEYQHALRIAPTDHRAQFNLGNAYRRLGRREDAMRCYQKVLKLKPDHEAAARALLENQ